MSKKIVVTKESNSGRNTQFLDNQTGKEMTRGGFVKEIKSGNYPGFHVRKINDVLTPCSNPDKSEKNNLG